MLIDDIEFYLALRRSLGFKLEQAADHPAGQPPSYSSSRRRAGLEADLVQVSICVAAVYSRPDQCMAHDVFNEHATLRVRCRR
jgi:hypothetical protein